MTFFFFLVTFQQIHLSRLENDSLKSKWESEPVIQFLRLKLYHCKRVDLTQVVC